jgi:hypothetical protein
VCDSATYKRCASAPIRGCMNVYELFSDLETYQNFTVKDEDHIFINQNFHARRSLMDSWIPIHISVMQFRKRGIDYGALPANDFPRIGGMPVFSRRAVECLEDILLKNGEVLPLLFEGKEGVYFAFNPLRDIDALNEELSDFARFEDGRIMHVKKYVFLADKLEGETLFKIPQQKGRIYTTDLFMERVKKCSLTGFLFIPLWLTS